MPLSMHPRLTLRVPAGQRRSWHRGEAARALDEESVVAVQGESSDWLWVMPGLPQAPQGAGGAGIIVLEADGGAAGAGPKGPFLAPGKGREVGLYIMKGSRKLCLRIPPLWTATRIIPRHSTDAHFHSSV